MASEDDYSSAAFDTDYYTYVRSVVGLWLLVVCVIGVPANTLVAHCAWRLCRRGPTGSALLYQYFVLSMSLADLLYASVVAPSLFGQFYLGLTYGRPWCTLMYTLSHCSTVCSSLSLLCLNLDKFIAIVRPLHHASTVTRGRVLVAVCASWLVSSGWSLFFVLGPALTYQQPCSMAVVSVLYYLLFTICFFVAPTLLAALFGCCIAVIAYRNERRVDIRARRNTVASTGSYGSVASTARTLTFVFATTAWSVVTYLPYRVLYPFYAGSPFQAWHLPVGFALFSLMAANPAGNPLITVLTQRRYRVMLVKLWRLGSVRRMARRASACGRTYADEQDTVMSSGAQYS